MVRVAGLPRDWTIDGSAFLSFFLSLGSGDAVGPGLHVLDPGLRHRDSAAGRADAAFARRSLPRLPVAHQRLLSAATAGMIPKLWMARRFPHSRVTAVSNSNSQREFIEGEA